MRVLRIELRRSVAAGIGALLVALGVYFLFWGGLGANLGSWASMAYATRSGLGLTWPLALGAGAWQARRERIGGVAELFTTSSRSPARQLLPVAAALAISVVLASLVVLLLGTVQLWRSPADAYLTLNGALAAAVGALSLVSAAWLGLALGRVIPSAFTAPLVTVLGLALVMIAATLDGRIPGPAFSLLKPDLPVADAHLELPLDLSLEQGGWLLALAVTAFAIAAAGTRRGRVLALLPAVAATVVVLPLLPPSTGGDALMMTAIDEQLTVYTRDPAAMSPVCTRDLPRICVQRVHSGLLPEVVGPARHALDVLSMLPGGPTAATEVPPSEEDGPVADLPPRTLAMPVYLQHSGHVDNADELTALMLQAALSPPCPDTDDLNAEQRDLSYVAEDIASTWLARRATVAELAVTDPERVGSGLKALEALPAAVQKRRISAFWSKASDCQPDAYRAITGATP